jgi:hypothetical protein
VAAPYDEVDTAIDPPMPVQLVAADPSPTRQPSRRRRADPLPIAITKGPATPA